jgi:Fic family protein
MCAPGFPPSLASLGAMALKNSGKNSGKTSGKKKPSAPAPEPPKPLTLEERTAVLEQRLSKCDGAFLRAYRDNLDISWIYHDSALEGVVYTFQELRTAIDPNATMVADSSLQPACEEIRRHREALNFIRDYAPKKRQPINLDVIKRIYLLLHPEEGDLKTVRYRKDIPQHRLYFHEYAAPDKITYKIRQVIDWVNDPETKKTRNSVRIASRAHYDLLRVFPFTQDSGKVARLFMNLLLLRSGYPPAIVHSTERQRYYDALKGSSSAMTQIVQESIENNLGSVEKLLDQREKPKSNPPPADD